MKKNNFIYAILLTVSVFFVACSGGGESNSEAESEGMDSTSLETSVVENFDVNLENSMIGWRGEMFNIKTHEGTVKLSEANVNIENGSLSGGSFVVDLTTIIPTDENYQPEQGYSKEKLVGHLSSADFFSVDSFPTASFTIESVEGNTATGTLTVRGTSNQEKVENITMSNEEGVNVLRGTMTFDRMKYGVAFTMSAADMIISDDVQLDIKLVSSN